MGCKATCEGVCSISMQYDAGAVYEKELDRWKAAYTTLFLARVKAETSSVEI